MIAKYRLFVGPDLDYSNIIYNQPSNTSLPDKIKSVQYSAALAIAGYIKGISKEKLYQKLVLELLRTEDG